MSGRRLLPVPVATGPAALELLPMLSAALNGSGPALLPHLPSHPPASADAVPDGLPGTLPAGADDRANPTTAVIETSGSTGTPRRVLLDATALLASASATHDRLGGGGQWLLALPVHHVAGLQVLVRSLVAGTVPTVLDLTRSLSPDAFAHSVAAMRGARRYTALVPAQLIRILDAGGAAEAALASLDAVLVGGAALPPTVRDRAGGAGARIVTTYGMTETCGGCVYDGRPLDGVTPRLADDGRIELAGPVLARGYLDGAAATPGEGGGPAPFVTDADGLRWLRTGDVGRWNGERLVVLGRADDAITTGGLTISPHAVEHAVLTLPEIAEAVVVGLPDRVWGQRVVAAVVLRPGALPPSLERVRRAVTEALEPGAAPRDVVVLDALPVRGVGKPDREAVAERLRRSR